MTLYELCKAVTIQGNVRISIFDEAGEEENVFYIHDIVDDLLWDFSCEHDFREGMEDYEVTYMFVGQDNYLHIELQKGE